MAKLDPHWNQVELLITGNDQLITDETGKYVDQAAGGTFYTNLSQTTDPANVKYGSGALQGAGLDGLASTGGGYIRISPSAETGPIVLDGDFTIDWWCKLPYGYPTNGPCNNQWKTGGNYFSTTQAGDNNEWKARNSSSLWAGHRHGTLAQWGGCVGGMPGTYPTFWAWSGDHDHNHFSDTSGTLYYTKPADAPDLSDGEWHHIAMVRSTTITGLGSDTDPDNPDCRVRVYIDGVCWNPDGSPRSAMKNFHADKPGGRAAEYKIDTAGTYSKLHIFSWYNGGNSLVGWGDDFRITHAARWTENFDISALVGAAADNPVYDWTHGDQLTDVVNIVSGVDAAGNPSNFVLKAESDRSTTFYSSSDLTKFAAFRERKRAATAIHGVGKAAAFGSPGVVCLGTSTGRLYEIPIAAGSEPGAPSLLFQAGDGSSIGVIHNKDGEWIFAAEAGMIRTIPEGGGAPIDRLDLNAVVAPGAKVVDIATGPNMTAVISRKADFTFDLRLITPDWITSATAGEIAPVLSNINPVELNYNHNLGVWVAAGGNGAAITTPDINAWLV